MKLRQVIDGLWSAAHGNVNVFAVQNGDGITLIDTGSPEAAPLIIEAVAPLGPITDIIVTHCHSDHAGGIKELVDHSGARVWMHGIDADLIERGESIRPYKSAPTLIGNIFTRLMAKSINVTLPPVKDIRRVDEGETIAPAGGFEVFHMPGHCAGQIALTWQSASGQRVLFAADVCGNVIRLGESILYEDREIGLRSLKRLAQIAQSADVAVFGHGKELFNPAKPLQRFADKY